MASLWDTLIGHVKSQLPSHHAVNSAGEALLDAPFDAAKFVSDLFLKHVTDLPSVLKEGKDVLTGDFKGAAKEIVNRNNSESPVSKGIQAVHDAIHKDVAPAQTTAQKYVDATLRAGPAGLASEIAQEHLPDAWWKPAAVDLAGAVAGFAVPEGLSRVKGLANLPKFKEEDFVPEAPLASDGLPGNGSVSPIDPHEIASIMNDPEASGAKGINDNVPQRRTNNRDRKVNASENLPSETNLTQEEQPPVEAQAAANDALAPEDLRLVQEEQPPIEAQAAANEALAPEEDANVTEIPYNKMRPSSQFPTIPFSMKDWEPTPEGLDILQPGIVKKPPSINDATDLVENHSTDAAPPAPANDTSILDAVRNLFHNLMEDERGSLGYKKVKGRAKLEDIPENELTPAQRIVLAIREASPMLAEQESKRTAERAERFAEAKNMQHVLDGEEGYHAELAKLQGTYFKSPALASIRNKITPDEIKELFNQTTNHPNLSYTESIQARSGLAKLLNEEGVFIPEPKEIELLERVFPDLGTALRKRSTANMVADALNTMRSIKTSGDLSAPLRQGLPLIGTKAYWVSLGKMFTQISEKGFEKSMAEIMSRPSFQMMRDHGLEFTDTSSNLSKREEKFQSTYAEKIPVVGKVVQGSERAFTGFLNTLRANRFDDLVEMARKAGKPLTSKDLDDIAEVVNNGTGRGDLNALIPKSLTGDFDANKVSPILSGTFFSPRFMASRLQMLNPMYYKRLSPLARTEALKQLMAVTTFNLIVMGMAHEAGLKVGVNPLSPDFGYFGKGHSLFGFSGGITPWIRVAAQEIMGEKDTPEGGKKDLTSHEFGQPTRLSTGVDFLRNKAAPPVALTLDLLEGENRKGEPLDRHHLLNVAERFGEDAIPMVYNDTKGVHDDLGPEAAVPAAVLSFFGGDVNTFEPRKKSGRGKRGSFDNNFKSKFGSFKKEKF
jgi:hypothetical protein